MTRAPSVPPTSLAYRLLRSSLFALPPESAHQLSLCVLGAYGTFGPAQPLAGPKPRRVLGLEFVNVIGLAAGWDKDATAFRGAARLGFGCVEVGTVTPLPQSGNARPRLFRLETERALINRMGFNNGGVHALVERVRRWREREPDSQLRLGINIGKNQATPLEDAGSDYLGAYQAVAPLADYVTVNLSSPNTPGLRALQQRSALRALLEPLKEAQQRLSSSLGRVVPLVVKVAPDLSTEEIDGLAEELLATEVDGLLATNTTLARPVPAGPLVRQAGGLSGAPLKPLSRAVVGAFAERLKGRVAIIGVGGIETMADGQALLDAGASLLQLYSGFIYQGPALVRQLARL